MTVSTRRRRRGPGAAPYLMAAPAVVLFVAFFLIPIGYAIWLSLHAMRVRGRGFGVRTEVFVGMENYVTAITDSAMYEALVRMLAYGLIMVPVTMGLALSFALMLDVPKVAEGLHPDLDLPAVRGAGRDRIGALGLHLPARGQPDHPGVHRAGPARAGLLRRRVDLLLDREHRDLGLGRLQHGGALHGAARDAGRGLRAAKIDGANEWQIAWKIKIPLLAPALIMTSVFSLIGMLQVFSEPNTVKSVTNSITPDWVPLMRIYQQAFIENDVYLGSATSVLLALATVLMSLAALAVFRLRARRSA